MGSMKKRSSIVGVAFLVAAALAILIAPVSAHPLGNFTISHYAEVHVQSDGLAIAYVLDLAEIPAFEELSQRNEMEAQRHLTRRLQEWVGALELLADGGSVKPLTLNAARISCPPGIGGLPTLRVEADLWAGIDPLRSARSQRLGIVQFLYRDTNFPERSGWKEIVVTGEGVRSSSVPALDGGSNRLRIYPSGFLSTPPNDVEARFTVSIAQNARTDRSTGRKVQSVTFDLAGCQRSSGAGLGAAGPFAQFKGFLALGVRHILTGYDHVLFLLCLLMLGGGLGSVLKVVTAFTVAHSLTLSLAVLNVVNLPGRFVESAIALSIVYVAAGNLRRKHVRLPDRWLVTFGFGLVHGLGFASVLKDMAIPRTSLALSLAGFNLGVEVGQVAVVTLAFVTLWGIRRWPWEASLRRALSAAAGAIGLFWFLQRAVLGS